MKRDGNKCCITGKAGTIWDPLLVVPILPTPSGWTVKKVCECFSSCNSGLCREADESSVRPHIFEMLGVFFSPPYRDWWLSYASNPERLQHHRSHWLVRKSAAGAFAHGLVKLDRRQPSMIEVR